MIPHEGGPPSISVFFPCYNEQENVAKVAQQAIGVLEGLQADYEVIIVNDGSADQTGPRADQIAARQSRVRVIHHPRNLGYGAASPVRFSGRHQGPGLSYGRRWSVRPGGVAALVAPDEGL